MRKKKPELSNKAYNKHFDKTTRALVNEAVRKRKPRQKSVPKELIVPRQSDSALHYLTVNQLDQLEAMASIGLRIVEVCVILGFSPATFYRMRNECPQIDEIWDRGRNLGKRSLLKVATEKARNGDNEMIKFILSRIHGLYEHKVTEHRKGLDIYDGMTEGELQARVNELEERILCAQKRPQLKLLLPPEAPPVKNEKP